MSEIELKARQLLAVELKEHCPAYARAVLDAPTLNGVPSHISAGVRAVMAAIAPQWQPIESAPKDGNVWAFNGEQGVMAWSEGDGWALWIWADALLSDADPAPEQPTHWQPLPAPPEIK